MTGGELLIVVGAAASVIRPVQRLTALRHAHHRDRIDALGSTLANGFAPPATLPEPLETLTAQLDCIPAKETRR